MRDDETLRNACTEVTSADPDDVCNLGSINMSRIQNITEFADVVTLATKFLLCGTIRGKVPSEAVERSREKNRRLGLGLMGMAIFEGLMIYDIIVNKCLRQGGKESGSLFKVVMLFIIAPLKQQWYAKGLVFLMET